MISRLEIMEVALAGRRRHRTQATPVTQGDWGECLQFLPDKPGNPGGEPCRGYEESRRSWKWRRCGMAEQGGISATANFSGTYKTSTNVSDSS
jgi:hypothetical protein